MMTGVGTLFIKIYDYALRAGEIMGRRREKKEGKRGEVGVVDYSMGEWMRPSITW